MRASGLTDGKGSVISADNISVFAEKYILVDTINEQNGALLGYYPDCLVPMENYAAAGENFVEAGCNQGFGLPSGFRRAEPGTYTGALQIVADGEINDIPCVNVSELAVSETVRTKSVFLNQFDYYKGELDSTLSMYKKYNDALLEFRLAPDVLYDRQYATEEGYALYGGTRLRVREQSEMFKFYHSLREGERRGKYRCGSDEKLPDSPCRKKF